MTMKTPMLPRTMSVDKILLRYVGSATTGMGTIWCGSGEAGSVARHMGHVDT